MQKNAISRSRRKKETGGNRSLQPVTSASGTIKIMPETTEKDDQNLTAVAVRITVTSLTPQMFFIL